MFAGNAFGWPYLGEAYAGTTGTTSDITDTDTGTAIEAVLTAGVVVAKTDTDAASFNDPSKRNDVDHSKPSRSIATAIADTDTVAAADAVSNKSISDTDSAVVTDAGAISAATPPPAPDAETFIVSAAETLAVAITGSDTATVTDDESALVDTNVALNDSDTGTLAELASNSGGGIASSFYGVVLALDDTALAAEPVWTRIDDPVGVA